MVQAIIEHEHLGQGRGVESANWLVVVDDCCSSSELQDIAVWMDVIDGKTAIAAFD